MRLTTILAAAAFVAPPPVAAVQAAKPVRAASVWHGRYVWEEEIGPMGGTGAGGAPVAFITHTLSIGPDGGSTGCRLDGEGLQTNTRILCTATPTGRSLVIAFRRFGPDNRFGDYRVGAPLLTLTRGPGGITTRLQGLSAADGKPRSGKLFRRVG